MAFFIGNSYCGLCQTNEKVLKNELLLCRDGLRSKGLIPPPRSFHSSRLPQSNKIWISNFIKYDFKDVEYNHNVNSFNLGCLDINNFMESVNNLYSFNEIKLHSEIYKVRSDVNAICHTNSPYTVYSFCNETLENVHGEASLILGDIPVIKLDDYSSEYRNWQENWDKIIADVSKYCIGEPLRPIRTIILRRHGVVSLGSCLHEARAFVEILEEWARFNIFSKRIAHGDQIHILSIEQLRSIGGRYARSIKFGGRRSF